MKKVLEEEVGVNVVASDSSNATTVDSSSIDKSSNDESDGGGENVVEYEYNSPSPFIGEEQFTHATQDEDHGSRATGVGIGAIGKTFEGRRREQQTGMSQIGEESLSMIFLSMSMDTEHSSYSDSQNVSNFNTLYQCSYGAYNIFDYPLPQMPYEIMHGDEQYPPT